MYFGKCAYKDVYVYSSPYPFSRHAFLQLIEWLLSLLGRLQYFTEKIALSRKKWHTYTPFSHSLREFLIHTLVYFRFPSLSSEIYTPWCIFTFLLCLFHILNKFPSSWGNVFEHMIPRHSLTVEVEVSKNHICENIRISAAVKMCEMRFAF